MKQTFLTLFLAIVMVSLSFGQTVYKVKYLGPANTAELTTLLETSKDPLIKGLDASTKASLIKNMYFKDGLFRGMDGSDANIKKLYETNFLVVLGAILQTKVSLNNNPTPKTYTVVSGGSGSKTVPECSVCENCYFPHEGGTCCLVGAYYGCCDYMVSNQ